MIMKKRSIPLVILILQALLRRLPKKHPKRTLVMEELSKRERGYQSEEFIDNFFDRVFDKKYMIFHDLNLSDGAANHQIDTLLVSSELILIIDVKNMTGTLVFDLENEQFYQINEDKEIGYPDPITQAQRHQYFIKKLLAQYNFPPEPIDYLIVNTNSSAIHKFTIDDPEIKKRVCRFHNFLKKEQCIERMYTNKILTLNELERLGGLLLKLNTPPTSSIFKKFSIQKTDLLTGVQCPNCNYLPMVRQKKSWFCPVCKTYSKKAHALALLDYFLLFDSKITNSQFRLFAHLASADTSGRILRSANLSFYGTNKGRVYFPEKIPW